MLPKEDLLHFLWKGKTLFGKAFLAKNGERVEVIHPGYYNIEDGPDFKEAKIRIDGRLWAGSVEIHVKTTDWRKHGHQHNQQYNNVILHVVYIDDECSELEIKGVPTLELKPFLPQALLKKYLLLQGNQSSIPCENYFPKDFPKLKLSLWQERLAIERFERKVQRISVYFHKTEKNFSHTFFILLSRYFGSGQNREAFETLDYLIEKLTGRKIEIRFLVGKLSYKAGFEEEDGHADVFYGYELTGSLDPVFAIKYIHPFGLNAIVPGVLKKFADFLAFNLFVEGAFNLTARYYRDSIDNKGGDLQAEFKLEFGVEGGAAIKKDGLWGRKEYKVIDAKLSSTSGIAAIFGPVVEQKGLGVRANMSWDGIKLTGSIIALDGLYTYKKSIVLIKEQKLLEKEKLYFFKSE